MLKIDQKSVYIRLFKIRRDELMSLNSSSNETRLIAHPWPSKRSSPNRPNSLPTSGRKTNISGLWNLSRYSFYCRVIISLQLWSVFKVYLYSQACLTILKKNKYHRHCMEKRSCRSPRNWLWTFWNWWLYKQ